MNNRWIMDEKKYIEVEYRRIKDEREYYRNLTGLMVHALKGAEYELTVLQGLEANDNGGTFQINSQPGLGVIQKSLNMEPEKMAEDITLLLAALKDIEIGGTTIGQFQDRILTPSAATARIARERWEIRK